jgi:hypothetical protein
MEFWWPRLAHAAFDPASANAIDHLRLEIDDANRRGHLGSAFQGGVYAHVNKDLRQLLGDAVAGPWSRTYCGSGEIASCRAVLWNSLAESAAALEARYGSPTVADWKWAISEEDVRHSAVGVTAVPAIHWINRPTFQQVVNMPPPVVVGHTFGAGSLRSTSGGKIGFVLDVTGYSDGEAEGALRLHDHRSGVRMATTRLLTAVAPADDACGPIAEGAPDSAEFTALAAFNGSGSHFVRACVQDIADPGKRIDKLYIECATCPYSTTTAAGSGTIHSGNIKVYWASPPAAGSGNASVVKIQPALGVDAAPGTAVGVVVEVLDGQGRAIAGVPVALSPLTAIPGVVPVQAVTGATGAIAVVLPAPLIAPAAWVASAGGIESNPVLLE